MPEPTDPRKDRITRRAALRSTLAAGPIAVSLAAGNAFAAGPDSPDSRDAPRPAGSP